ncbi:MAG: hypothetical protein ABWX74_14585 [Aeromicrobium sp.]
MTRRALSWDLVDLETDPVPASEHDVDEIAAGYTRRGESLARTRDALQRLCAVEDWTGEAARRFAEHARATLSAIARAEEECSRIASVLSEYGGEVADARRSTARAVKDAEDADSRRRQAEKALEDAPADVLVPSLDRPGFDDDLVDQLKLDAAEQDLADAKAAVTTAVAQLATAAQAAATQIESSTSLTDAELFAPQALSTSAAELERLVDLARSLGKDPATYADLLQQVYVARAAEKAGIDLSTWDVDGGAGAVSDHYEKTYEYYAQLYLDNPNFRWAGMAAMIGPSFAAGFEDLDQFQDIAKDLKDALEHIPDSALPFPVDQLDKIAGMGEDELKYYQTTFLQMQKDIFYDASMMHEAYLDGGLESIEELRAAGLLGDTSVQADDAVRAWEEIDTGIRTGDTDLLNAGNERLLYREQYYTIAEQYRNMKDHPVTGEAMTYIMGIVGQPSIPGARTLGQVDDPIHIEIDTMPLVPGTQGADVTVNIPRSNIADFDTRWGLIEDDTLPVYLDLVENDPGRVEDILRTPVRDRIDDMHLIDRWPDIVDGLVDTEVKAW